MADITVSGIAIASVSGIFAAYVGWLTTYSKWVLERRLEAFAKFLPMLSSAREEASNICLSKTPEEWNENWHSIQLEIIKIYEPVHIQANICRLFMREDLRHKFYILSHSFWNKYDKQDQAIYAKDISDTIDGIQEIFEQNISFLSSLPRFSFKR